MPDTSAEKSLRRVLLVSAIDGWSLTLFAGFCTLVSVLFGEWLGVSIGATITAAGLIELRGRSRLIRRDATGSDWLIRAQIIVLATVWLYAFRNLLAFDEAAILAELTPELRDLLAQWGILVADLQPKIKPVYFGLYLTVMGATLLFQGGLALYYQLAKTKVSAALAARPPL